MDNELSAGLGYYFKEKYIVEAEEYNQLNFLQKTKNRLILFFVFITAMSIGLTMAGDQLGVNLWQIAFGLSLYWIFLVFAFFNHRWAMVLIMLNYTIDKVFLIVAGVGFFVSHIIFWLVVAHFCFQAFMVAGALKKQKQDKKTLDTFS